MVEYGGRASQNQQLRFSRRPYFICTVFESIRLLCAQYLRNNSGVDSLVRRAQRAAGGGAEGLGFSADWVSVSLPSVCRSLCSSVGQSNSAFN